MPTTDQTAPVVPVVPMAPDAMTQIADVLKLLATRQDGMTPELVETIATASARAAATTGAESLRRVLHPQNAQHPGKSVFSYPEGDVEHPKPELRSPETFFCNSRLDVDAMTPTTIDLLNRFTRTVTARGGRWRADVAPDGRGLHVTVPCKTIDDRMELPSLDLILLELLDGEAAVDPISLADRVVALERQLTLREQHQDGLASA